jgi:hypothetical protein
VAGPHAIVIVKTPMRLYDDKDVVASTLTVYPLGWTESCSSSPASTSKQLGEPRLPG